MPNYKDLFYPQLGIETTYGCDAAPTLKLMGVDNLEIVPMRETEAVNVLDGRLTPSKTLVRNRHWGEATLSGLLIYEDSGLWLDSVFGALATTNSLACTTDATGVQRLYNAPTTTYDTDQAAPAYYTILYGDPQATASDAYCYSIISAIAQTMRITGESGGPAKIEVKFIGQDVEADALDATKVDRDVSIVMGDHWSLAIDPDSDAAGTTTIADIAFKFEMDVNTNRDLQWHLGDLVADSYRDGRWDGTLSLTLQTGTQVTGFLTSVLTSTPVRKVIRLKATSSSNTFQIDFNGALLEAPTMFTDQDGVTTVEMNFQGIYGSTLANWLRITTHNGVSAHATMT